MALRESGVNLIAKGYQAYMAALANVSKAQKATFDARQVKEYNAAVSQTTRSSKAWANVVSRASSEGKKFSSSIGGLAEGMGRFTKTTGGAAGGIGGLIGKVTGLMGASGGAAGGVAALVAKIAAVAAPAALAVAGIGLIVAGLKVVVTTAKKAAAAFAGFMKMAGQAAAENEMLGVLLLQVGKNAGYTEEQILAAEAAMRTTGITIEQSRRTLTTLAQSNIEWSDATKLARLAQNAATHALTDSSGALGRMIHGIQTNNRLILRNLGLVVDWETAQKKLAKELGVNVDQLTSFDLAQSRVNAVLAAGERIVGSYEAAMKTVGKQTGSMVRLVKDAQDAWGKLMLPIMMTSVELKSTFWVAMRDAGEGLGFLSESLGTGRDLLSDYASKVAGAAEKWLQAQGHLEKGQTIVDGLAERLFEASKQVVKLGVVFVATAKTIVEMATIVIPAVYKMAESYGVGIPIIQDLKDAWMILNVVMAQGVQEALLFAVTMKSIEEKIDLQLAAQEQVDAVEFILAAGSKLFTKNLAEIQAEAEAALPGINMTWQEWKASIDAAAESLERGTEALNRHQRALQQQAVAMEAAIAATAAMESIMLKYEKSLVSAQEKRFASLAALSEDASEKEQKISEDLADKLIQIEERAAERRAKLRSQYARNREKLELDYQKKLQQNYERYLLRRQQSQRRFALSEKRLAAAGDIIGLIQAREDEALRLKEEDENRELGLRHDVENYQARLAEMEAAFNEQMALLAQETEKQRRAAIDAATQQRLDMQRNLIDQRQLIEDNYVKQLQMAEQAKDDALNTLGRKIQAEGKMNEEGAQEWVDLMNKLYGVDGFADAFYKGYTDRADSVLTAFQDKQLAQLQVILDTMEHIEKYREIPSNVPTTGTRIPRPRHRRMGGEDIVTGPATFVVEPGVTEYHSFVPLPVSQAINVRHSGSFGLTGAQDSSPGMVDIALERMVDGFDLALKRLRRN